jgi:hypothetical protein
MYEVSGYKLQVIGNTEYSSRLPVTRYRKYKIQLHITELALPTGRDRGYREYKIQFPVTRYREYKIQLHVAGYS